MFRPFLILMFTFSSCQYINLKNNTPKEFLNHTIIKKDDYTKDSIIIVNQLTTLLLNRENFFHNKAYFDSTQLIIDSILYSPDLNKLAVFLMTKNPTHRQLMPNNKYKWYYDATCYLGVRQNGTIHLSWIGPSFTNAYNKEELSVMIRDSYFTDFATKDTVGLYTYKYNLNDIRFWKSSIWDKIEEDRRKHMEFEEEKKNHPENIYEPPNE